MSDPEREEALKVKEPVQEKRGNPNRKTGMIGVSKAGKKYQASIKYGGKQHNLGTFDTKEQAGIAYDRFVVDKSTEEVSFTLNYPNMSDPEREEALKVKEPVQKKRGKPNTTTGLIGVRKKYNAQKKKYNAQIWYGGTTKNLGTFDTKEQAGMAYDRFVVDKSTEEVSYTLNYPSMSDHERKAALKVEPRGNPNQKTGLIGVYKIGEKYRASIRYGGTTTNHLGRFDTKEQAGIAYDRFVIDKSTEEVSYALNYPKMSDAEREEALKVEEPVQQKRTKKRKKAKDPPKKKKRGNPNQKTGLIGVSKNEEKYRAMVYYGGKQHKLGTFDTKEQAGMAYDRFVVDKSTEEVSYALNYPNMSDHEKEVALPAEPPHKKRKRGTKKEHVTCTTSSEDDECSEKMSDDGSSSSSSSSSDSSHSSDDDESDEEEAVEPTPSPQAPPYFERDPMLDQLFAAQAPPYFERDPMLDQLFADAQNNKQQQQDQVVRGTHVH